MRRKLQLNMPLLGLLANRELTDGHNAIIKRREPTVVAYYYK